jgi:hypothetical protein
MGTSDFGSQGQQGQAGAIQALKSMITTVVTQSHQIQRDQIGTVNEQVRTTYDQLLTASGKADKDLRGNAKQQIVQTAAGNSQLSRDAQDWASRMLDLVDDRSLQSNADFQRACGTAIQNLTQVFTDAGLQTDASVKQYAQSQSPGYGTGSARHGTDDPPGSAQRQS